MKPASASLIHLPAVAALTDARLLDAALRQARALAVLRRLAQDQPSARTVAEGLAGWLTDVIPNRWETEPLLLTCIRQAKHALVTLPAASDTRTQLGAWLHGLSEPLPAVLDWRVVHADSGQVWDAVGHEPLRVWRQRGSGRLTISRRSPAERPIVTPDSVRLMVLGRLMDQPVLTAIGGHLPLILEGDDG